MRDGLNGSAVQERLSLVLGVGLPRGALHLCEERSRWQAHSANADPRSNEDRRNEGVRVFSLHFLTPVSSNYTIDRWMHIRNTKVKDEATAQKEILRETCRDLGRPR